MKRPLVHIGIGCILGAAVFSFAPKTAAACLGLALCFAILGLLLFLFLRPAAGLPLLSSAAVLLSGYLLIGMTADPALSLAGQTISLSGQVRQTYPTGFVADAVTEDGQDLSLVIWCQREMVPDRLHRFSGTVQLSPVTSTDRFDSEGYYRSRGIFLQGQLIDGSFAPPDRYRPADLPIRFSDFLCGRINALLPQEYAGLVCAAVLGQRQYLSDGQYELMQNIGVSHLLAVSGMHLTLFHGVFSLILPRTRKKLSAFLSVLFILFYLLLTGMTPSVVRAGIMLLLSHEARLFMRQADPPSSYFFAVSLMLLINPFLLGTAAFQYSAVCTFGVNILSPLLQAGLCARLPQLFHRAAGTVSVALCAYLGAAPLTLFHESRLIWITVFANLLLAPLFSLLLFFSAGLTVFSFFEPMAGLFSALLEPTADLFFLLAGLSARIGGDGIYLPGTAPKIILLIVISFLIYTICSKNIFHRRLALTCTAVACCASICTQSLMLDHRVTVTAAAFGNSLLTVCSCGGHGIVIGHLSSTAQVEQAAGYLRRERVHTVDMLVLLPCKGDPRVSLSAVCDAFPVSLILFSPQDNAATQFTESIDGIPQAGLSAMRIGFWNNCRMDLSADGETHLRLGAKNLLILPADCAILKKDRPPADLLITSADTPPAAEACVILSAKDFWGESRGTPAAFRLPYAVGQTFTVPL